ncbi:hypothetical protein PIB30_030804, partial [Stylosanthes scabra]|nr:hypothetical protein [Stylosanthes scabra]
MALVEEMGFGAFASLPDYNLKQHMLQELVNIFDIYDNTIHTVSEKELSEEDHAVFKMFQGKNQTDLTRLVLRTPVDTEVNRILFKRAFFIFIQKCFLLATSSPNVTPKPLPTLFDIETTRERNWTLHVHDFLLDEIKKAKLNKTKAVHGCCYVLMIIYFHETHFGKNPREPEAQLPWITYWTGENLKKRLLREQNHGTGLIKTGMLRATKERLQRRNMELKMGVNIKRKEPESSESESAESESEEDYESEEESDESSSGGSSPKVDYENTMSEELVQRRPLSNPSLVLQERRSKKRQEPVASGVQRTEDRPLAESNIPPTNIVQQGTGALGKRKHRERATKAKKGTQGLGVGPANPETEQLQPQPQTHPQPQGDRARKRRLIKLADRVGCASD